MKLENSFSVSHETICRLVKANRDNGGDLYLHLRHGRRRRKKRFSIARVRQDILRRRPIAERPDVINTRERFGDWERDLMFGVERSAALLTFVERKTQLIKIVKVNSKSPQEIANKTISVLAKEICHSITNDKGFEFRAHERESAALQVPIYFTNPYTSWEKGTCENANGLIRQYFARTQNTKDLTDESVKEIEFQINSRPRKKLGFQTPLEASSKSAI